MLSLLEDCGYMSRVAFIMDKLFRKFGLSGKSFIPLLVATGCGVPGIMSSRTIEQERDRRMTVMTTGFIPCGAKMPLVGLIAGALFSGSPLVATSAYLIGIAAVILSGLILKKTKPFAGEPAPFVMELPTYHAPVLSNTLRSTWERGWDFIKRAGTVIFVASVVIWTLNNLSLEGGLHYITDTNGGRSVLEVLGTLIAWIFAPLGFGSVQATVATLMGLVAKEEIVGVLGVLDFGGMGKLAGYAFLVFNLLCAPCFAAMGAIRREMNSAKWTAFAIGYQCVFAYAVSLCIYQIGSAFTGNLNVIGLIASVLVIAAVVYMLFFKKYAESKKIKIQ
jgi:ferrous iron transport protein B